MRVMIVGHGYVGSAVASIFADDEKVVIDPKLSDDIVANHSGEKFDAVFVCVTVWVVLCCCCLRGA